MQGTANKQLVLAAMIFAVAMMFIDQTIVSIAIPDLQKDLSLSSTGVQWIVNGYLLSLSALFAFGGRLADIAGHRRMVLIGVIGFATSSALCGATPTGGIGEAWMIFFRVVQGATAALLFPAALAIVVGAFPVAERGRAMATFFGITGGLTAIGPLAGGYLTEYTWRAIFWVNVPVALIAVALILRSKPEDNRNPAPLDMRGAVLISGGMGLAVLGLQQSSTWGWGDPVTWICIVAGLALLGAFVRFERTQEHPVIDVRIFRDRAFTVDNAVLFLMSMAFVPLFLFASIYAQVGLGDDAGEAGVYLLHFFIGFAIAAQVGGRILDKRGARGPVLVGSLLSAVGFALWASKLTDLDFGSQRHLVLITGFGLGLVLGPVSTDAVNRASSQSYGEVTGITQTFRNFGASIGLAVLGTILILQNKAKVEDTLTAAGLPKGRADRIADAISHAGGSSSGFAAHAGPQERRLFGQVQMDFAQSCQVVFYGMAVAMALAFLVAAVGMRPGKAEDPEEAPAPAPA